MVAGGKKHEKIRAMILERYRATPAGTAIPPEMELAGEYGVSRVTVARALNDLVRDGVLNRHQGKGTFIAERQERKSTACIGLLYSHDGSEPLSNPFYRSIIAGVHDTLIASDYAITVMGVRNSRMGTLLQPEEAAARQVDGLIVVNVMNPEYFVRLLRTGLPVVGVEYHFEAEAPCDYIVQDCEASAYEAIRRLIELGHRRIAFFGHATRNINPLSCPDQNSLERLAGVRRAFQNAGLGAPEDILFQPPHPHWKSSQALLEHVFEKPLPPTAVFCEAADSLGELVNFFRAQCRKPQNFPLCITTSGETSPEPKQIVWQIEEDWTEIGRMAARRMLKRLEQPQCEPQTFKLPWRLISTHSDSLT